MPLNTRTLRSGLQFLSCEVEDICRLCLKTLSSSTESLVKLNQTLKLTNREYYDQPVTLADVFVDLGISIDETLPQLLCETCTVTVVNGFLLPKLLAYSEQSWHTIVQYFQQNLEKGNEIKDISNALYLPLKDNMTEFLFLKRLEENTGKAAAVNIFKKIKPRDHKLGLNIINKSHNITKPRKLKNDILYEHSDSECNETFQCTLCLNVTKTKSAYKKHLEKSHNLFLCTKCLQIQPSKEKLKEHRLIHKSANTAISVICPKCDKTYANKTTFRLHDQICGQSTDVKFICEYCNQGYIRKNSLRTHIKTAHGFGKVLSCKWCEKKFDAKSKLNEHTIKHTQVKKFTCEFCGAKCATPASLACHIRLHTGDKPFPCNLCEEKFVSASRRLEHVRRKHEGPHKECHICTAKFYSTAQLKKHLDGHSNPNSRIYEMGKKIKSNMECVSMSPDKIVESSKSGEKFYVYIVPAKSESIQELTIDEGQSTEGKAVSQDDPS